MPVRHPVFALKLQMVRSRWLSIPRLFEIEEENWRSKKSNHEETFKEHNTARIGDVTSTTQGWLVGWFRMSFNHEDNGNSPRPFEKEKRGIAAYLHWRKVSGPSHYRRRSLRSDTSTRLKACEEIYAFHALPVA